LTVHSDEGARRYAFFGVVIAAAVLAVGSAVAQGDADTGTTGADGLDPAQAAVLVESGCTACHTPVEESQLAPPLDGVYARAGQRVQSAEYAGTASDADSYLLESILDHCADPLPGWDCSEAPQYGNWIGLEEAYRLVDALARGG
jgi:hypothetical protein